RLVDGVVERDARRAVDDEVEIPGELHRGTQTAFDDRDAVLDRFLDSLGAHLVAPGGEDGLLEQGAYAVFGAHAAFDAYEDRDLRAGVVAQQSLEHGLADEPGGAGEEDVGGAEVGRRLLGGHGTSLAASVVATGPNPGSAA